MQENLSSGVPRAVAVGGKPVDVARVDAGILTGCEDRLEAQNEFRLRRLAVTVIGRLADPGHSHLAAHASSGHAGLPPYSALLRLILKAPRRNATGDALHVRQGRLRVQHLLA
jgi:hypothetical protein